MRQTGVNRVLRMAFGIFMVLVYLGMAALMAINYFGLSGKLNWVFAAVMAADGLYRGYRELKGEHSYGMPFRPDDDEERYTTYDSKKSLYHSESDEKEQN